MATTSHISPHSAVSPLHYTPPRPLSYERTMVRGGWRLMGRTRGGRGGGGGLARGAFE
jgi:hypothetical protein